MAYISGYDYDIFISYAHDDNDEPDDKAGWVDQFHNYLENWLVKRRQLKGLKIWFDKSLQGNTAFDKEIQQSIEKSALFFVIHSGNYHRSEYCRKELNWFINKNSSLPNGVMINNQSRIFNLLINNIQHEKWPEELAGTSGFELHDAQQDNQFGYPTSSKDKLFDKQMRKLVEGIADILEAMPKSKSEDKLGTNIRKNSANSTEDSREYSSQPPSNLPKVFLADVADTLQPFRKRLINEMGDKAIILPSFPPPYEEQAHQQQLAETLEQSSLTIHLLDQWAGRNLDGSEDLTYPRLQANRVKNTDSNSLIWVPDSLTPEDIEDDIQANWLNELETGTRNSSNFQFVRSSRNAFIEQVKHTLAELNDTQNDLFEDVSFLIDTHQKDQRYAYEVANLLSGKGVDVDFNKESQESVQNLDNFENAVRNVKNLVIMFGAVAPHWVRGRIETAAKVVLNQFNTDSMKLNSIWVFMLPESQGMKAVGQLPPLFLVNCLDNTASETIDASVIESLLESHKDVT